MAVTTIKDGFNGGSDNQLKVNSDGSINVTGGGSSNASVGLTGQTAPTSATEIGAIDSSGKLQPLLIDSTGRLEVDAGQIFGVQNLKVLFNEVTAIAVGIETTINTYTAPVTGIAYLLTILNSGENRASYQVYNNGTLFDKQYTVPTQLSAQFDYKTGSSSVPGMVIAAGNTILVKTTNSGTTSASYSSRFMILEVT